MVIRKPVKRARALFSDILKGDDPKYQYTYLGYIMNSKWDVSGTIKNNKNK
ncbi:hypothetical protein AYI69_g7683, partial [Smittium culicis]